MLLNDFDIMKFTDLIGSYSKLNIKETREVVYKIFQVKYVSLKYYIVIIF